MVFSNLFFLFIFLPAFILCYCIAGIIDRRSDSQLASPSSFRAKNIVLVCFSLIFYAWGEPIYVFLMLASVAVNFKAGQLIDQQERFRKWALAGGLTANLLILGTFKYLGFFAQIATDCGWSVPVPHIPLPIGISFYTFQSISYLVDVYRKEAPAQKRFSDLLLYISMFPQLIAGPIVRYNIVAQAIHDRKITINDFSEGAFRFLIGLGKKVILANQLSEIVTQFLGNNLSDLSTSGAWIGITAFALQIFFDFSGYSDMAIGMGRCLGFHFNENFNHPYCCLSITDFWRRWHISLGSFFRDYVYIPMGGNRKHQTLNILVVWFLTGMWHGASWNFILWGLYFGLIVTIEKYTLLRAKHRIPRFVLHLYSLFLVLLGWGLFYFEDFSKTRLFFASFFGLRNDWSDFISKSALLDNFWLWIIALLFCLPIYDCFQKGLQYTLSGHHILQSMITFVLRLTISIILLALSVSLLIGATNNAFIYTRF